jgi:restriction endonuclease S subunit
MKSIYTLQQKAEIVDRLQEAIILVDFRAGQYKAIAKAEKELDAFTADSLSINFESVIKAIYEAVDTVEPHGLKFEPPLKALINYIIYGEEHPDGKKPFTGGV